MDPNNPFGRTQVRYYTLANLTNPMPTVWQQGNFTSGSLSYFMPSNAIDRNGVVGYTFSASSSTTHPVLYMDTLTSAGVPGTATVVPGRSFNGSENGNSNDGNRFWGEFVSTTLDPADYLKFWSIGGYYTQDQVGCTSGSGWSGCNWHSTIFSCIKGGANCP